MDQVTLQFSKIKNTTVQANDACVSATNSRDYIAIPESGAGWSFNFVSNIYVSNVFMRTHRLGTGATCAPMGGDGCRQINSRYCGGNLNFSQAVCTKNKIGFFSQKVFFLLNKNLNFQTNAHIQICGEEKKLCFGEIFKL